MKICNLSLFLFLGLFLSCNEYVDTQYEQNKIQKMVKDEHTYSNYLLVPTKHLYLDLEVNFDRKILSGKVVHEIDNVNKAEEMIFDIKDLIVKKVELDNGHSTEFKVGSENDDLLGTSLAVKIKSKTEKVTIYYETTPESGALQWLNPQQTAGKKHPYLFTQGQAILTRTWIPCQDTPGNRITYSANIKCPAELMAVMSADNPTKKSLTGEYSFKMDNPIPCYLIALAVGDLEFSPLGDRTGVYTEPSMMKKCVDEFTDVEKMVEAAEELYGQYKWGRYDIIVLPPSFPFGGMENPKLTFATPTILTGDKSLVSLIAHELAHSWSGNLVTNATWDDFWLNEGFTVYFENRIMEKIYGEDRANMLLQIEYQELVMENEDILSGDYPEDTHLKLNLTNRDPDDGMTSIAYVKGAMFLKTLEITVGREKFDAFLSQYFSDHEFQTLTTEDFIAYLDKNLLNPNNINFNTKEWVYGKGIPANCAVIESDNFKYVEEKSALVSTMKSTNDLNIDREWSTQEWIHFIRNISDDVTVDKLVMLDNTFNFTNSGNAEIMTPWFVLSIKKGHKGINSSMENFLINVGRRKFLDPIYRELAKTPENKLLAQNIYRKARPNYHSVSYNTIDVILDWEKKTKKNQ